MARTTQQTRQPRSPRLSDVAIWEWHTVARGGRGLFRHTIHRVVCGQGTRPPGDKAARRLRIAGAQQGYETGPRRPVCGPTHGATTLCRGVATRYTGVVSRRRCNVAIVSALVGCGASQDQRAMDEGSADSAGPPSTLDAQAVVQDAKPLDVQTTDADTIDVAPFDDRAATPFNDAAAAPFNDAALRETGPLPPDPCIEAGTCPIGLWTNVTPTDMPAAILRPTLNAFGPGSIVADPARPSDLYVGGSSAGLWRSSDYGFKWTRVNNTLPDVPRGVTIAVAGTTPATIWAAGFNVVYKSIDGGTTFNKTRGLLTQSLYSLKVDPYDNNHLLSGLHEVDGLMESIDGGDTWKVVGGVAWPPGGKSWYPDFVDTGNATTTRQTWFAIAQNGASAVMTSDAGAHWSIPNGLSGLQHPHGNSQIFQAGSTLFVAGVYGPGQGVYRSTNLGADWSRVDTGRFPEAIVWGSPKNVYAMYAWACSNCNLGTDYETAAQPGVTWSAGSAPSSLVIGPNSVAATNDGAHHIFVAVMWDQGIWRYVEP